MKTKITAALALSLSCLASALPAAASASSSSPPAPVPAYSSAPSASASAYLGQDVNNLAGEKLGEINDLVVDAASGKVVYALIGSGGFLGIGEAVRAVPFSAFGRNPDATNNLVLDLPRATWNTAPTMAANRIDLLADDKAGADTLDFYRRNLKGDVSRRGPGKDARLMRASEIIGRDVTHEGHKVGAVEDLIVHRDSRKTSVLLDPDDDFTGTDQKFLIGLRQLEPALNDRLKTDLTRADFSRTVSTSQSWWDADVDSPYPWLGYATLAGPAYQAARAGAFGTETAATTAREADQREGRRSVAVIRERLRSHASLSDAIANVTLEQNGNHLVVKGTVPSEEAREQVSDTVQELAKDWNIDNRLRVRSAAE